MCIKLIYRCLFVLVCLSLTYVVVRGWSERENS